MTIDATILDRISARDSLAFEMGDALDTKASIALVVITFLGTQTAWFVTERRIDGFWLLTQSVSALLLVVAGVLAIIALWPRKYDAEGVDGLEDWVGKLREHYKDDPDADNKVSAAVVRGAIKRAKERIAVNTRHNTLKAELIEKSFKFSSLAFALNLLIVVLLTIRYLS